MKDARTEGWNLWSQWLLTSSADGDVVWMTRLTPNGPLDPIPLLSQGGDLELVADPTLAGFTSTLGDALVVLAPAGALSKQPESVFWPLTETIGTDIFAWHGKTLEPDTASTSGVAAYTEGDGGLDHYILAGPGASGAPGEVDEFYPAPKMIQQGTCQAQVMTDFIPFDGGGTFDDDIFENGEPPVFQQLGWCENVRAQFASAVVAIAAYYSPTDGQQHVIAATSDGDVHDLAFQHVIGQ
jgi:hypothetical protein